MKTRDKQETHQPVTVFLSYAHEDEPLRAQLEKHLRLLQRQGCISTWHDRQIVPGTRWAEEIDAHLTAAQLVLLLISPDFLDSDYCYGIEMQRALQRHQSGEAQVIPILLRPVDWEGAPFTHLQCLPRDARAVTEWSNQDAAFRDIARGIRAAIEQLPLTCTQTPSVPAASGVPATMSTPAPAALADRNHQRMLKRVRATWIAGVLEQSLHGAALMVLGLEEKVDVLDSPWRLLIQEVDRPTQPLPEGTRITQVYDATEGGLLILGEPGAGKTTLLLELARDLLDRAQMNETAPIPVVFNLSSWAKKQSALSDWLVEELSIRYEVPRRLGQSWVNEDRLLLLLDGLDEVASAARKACIEAINCYRQTHPDVQIVVCSRSTEYLDEPTQLRLHTAVVVQPLTQEQIATYLESAGKQAEDLREALRRDADLRELATTPLMLTVLLFAYKGTSPDKISEQTTLEAKRELIFASYVQQMLKRRGASQRYKLEQITRWLTYLARQMKRQNQTVFYLEQMQPDWLPKQWQRSVYRALAGGVSGGLLGGLIGLAVGVIVGSSSSSSSLLGAAIGSVIGLNLGLTIGLIIGLLHLKSAEIRTAEVITWSWANARLAAIASIVGGSLGWLILFHSSSLISGFGQYVVSSFRYIPFYFLLETVVGPLIFLSPLILLEGICFLLISLFARRNLDGRRLITSRQRIWSTARRGVLVGIYMSCISFAFLLLTSSMVARLAPLGDIRYDIYLVAVGCVSGLITGLIYGVSSGQLERHNSFKPNQGIWYSLYNGGRVLLIVGLIVWLTYDLPVLVSHSRTITRDFPSTQFLSGVIVGLSIGLFFGLLNGGIACIKHVQLRVFLWRASALPWNCARFLDYAVERILLRKVGGGYIFVHRLLLEYFATLVTPLPEEASAIAARSDLSPALASTPQINTTLREERASPSVASRKTSVNKEKRVAALLAAVILLLALVCNASTWGIVLQPVQNTYNATATADNATATAQVEANATAEAVANASPIAYPPQNMSPILDDPLQDNSKGYQWKVDDSEKGNCQFINRAYDINTDSQVQCSARNTDFMNFIYEVQVKIVKGDGGGIAFRIDPTNEDQYYDFAIYQDGIYYIDDLSGAVLADSSPAIHRGLNQTNLVAAVVHGKTIELYVNHQRIAVVGSSTSTHGRIGLIATGYSNNQTEVIFQNAKVWRL